MGVGIFLWIERRMPSGEWSLVRRQEERKPDWQREMEAESAESESDGRKEAQAFLDAMRNKFSEIRSQTGLPAAPPQHLVEHLERVIVEGWDEPRHRWLIGKNYQLFSVMCGHTGRTRYAISRPRGFPSNLSDEVLEDATRLYLSGNPRATRASRLASLATEEGHGEIVKPSWVTVGELLAVDWDAATEGEGLQGECDFLKILHEELVPLGPPDQVRLVFFFDC